MIKSRVVAWLAVVFVFGSVGAACADPVNQSPYSGLAIHGYDPVAYFTEHAAVPGNREILYEHEGVTWAFSSRENLELFEQSPNHHIPQYGGYCAYAVSQNAVSDADPTAWQIEEGKLYLNYDNRVQRIWANRIDHHIETGDDFWPALADTIQ